MTRPADVGNSGYYTMELKEFMRDVLVQIAPGSTATVSRVRFKVPIALPVNTESAAKVQAAKKKATAPLPQRGGGSFARDWGQ
jgi:hypothetical protein